MARDVIFSYTHPFPVIFPVAVPRVLATDKGDEKVYVVPSETRIKYTARK